MIFPELPKRSTWLYTATDNTAHSVETPLRESTEPTGSSRITVEEWWIKHGLATDPAAAPLRSRQEPIDWLARDALEFYALCTGMVCWIVYWYGTHRGLW